MKESFGEGTGSPMDEDAGEADYRIREVEARLERRISALESQRERLRWTVRFMATGFAGILIALTLVATTAFGGERIVTARSLFTQEVVLRDSDGITRGRLGMDADGRAQFSLSDRDARTRIRLTVLADGSPGVTISDADARPRAVLGYLPDGTTSLVLADAQGTSRAVVGLEPDGATHALFADRTGAIRTHVGVGADGAPAVSVIRDSRQREPAREPEAEEN